MIEYKQKIQLNFADIFSSSARTKILRLIALENEVNISRFIKDLKLNHSIVKNHLDYLIKIHFVQEKRFGRIRIYRFIIENPKAKAVKNLIQYWESDL